MTCREIALEVLHAGYVPVLIRAGDKRPTGGKDWGSRRPTAKSIEHAFKLRPKTNVGILLGEAGGLIDIEADGEAARKVLTSLFPDLPATVSYTSDKGPHNLYLYDARFNGLPGVIRLDADGYRVGHDVPHVEVRLGTTKAAQSLLPPSVVGDGKAREWINKLSFGAVKLPDNYVELILASHKRPGPSIAKRAVETNKALEWDTLLTNAGWTSCGETNWTRPGNPKHPISGSIIKANDGDEIFHCFTGSAPPLEFGKNYSKFALYAAFEHEGDFKAAAAALFPKQDDVSAYDVELFASPAGDPFVTVEVEDHRETYKTDSKQFRHWLNYQHFKKTNKALGSQALAEAVATYTARATYSGVTAEVYTRLAGSGGRIYLDLGTKDWTAVEISEAGCNVVPHPVKFRRPRSLMPLVAPDFEGNINELRPFVNLSDDDFKMLAFVLVAYMRPRGPYPILMLQSQFGSAKTTSLRVVRQLFDPNASNVRAAPKNIYDLFLAAANSYCVTLDNVSTLPEWLADGLCQLATGGGLGTREYYGQEDERIIDAMRPAMVGCISDLTNRADFLSRSVVLSCLPISDDRRRTEDDLFAEYELARPRILGALCRAASVALRQLPGVRINYPRMADFARWGVAAETGLGYPAGTFESIYGNNQATTNSQALANPVAVALRAYIAKKKSFAGSASELLTALREHLGDDQPANAQVFSRRLRNLVGVIPLSIDIRPNRITVAA